MSNAAILAKRYFTRIVEVEEVALSFDDVLLTPQY